MVMKNFGEQRRWIKHAKKKTTHGDISQTLPKLTEDFEIKSKFSETLEFLNTIRYQWLPLIILLTYCRLGTKNPYPIPDLNHEQINFAWYPILDQIGSSQLYIPDKKFFNSGIVCSKITYNTWKIKRKTKQQSTSPIHWRRRQLRLLIQTEKAKTWKRSKTGAHIGLQICGSRSVSVILEHPCRYNSVLLPVQQKTKQLKSKKNSHNIFALSKHTKKACSFSFMGTECHRISQRALQTAVKQTLYYSFVRWT